MDTYQGQSSISILPAVCHVERDVLQVSARTSSEYMIRKSITGDILSSMLKQNTKLYQEQLPTKLLA